MAEPCCPAADEWEEPGEDDPTLSSCCAKDKAEAAAALRLRTLLSRTDPSRVATALRAAVLAPPPPPPAPAEGDEDDDESSELLALRLARLAELRRARQRTRGVGAQGVAETALPSLCAAHRVVLAHFPLPGHPASAELDEALDALARSDALVEGNGDEGVDGEAAAKGDGARGRAVVRVAPPRPGAAGSPTLRAAGCGAAPALLLLRGARVAASTAPGYAGLGAAGPTARGLRRWLAAQGEAWGGDGSGGEESEGDEGEGVGGAARGAGARGTRADAPPCACGRAYAHTHVRALRAGGARGSDDDEEDDD